MSIDQWVRLEKFAKIGLADLVLELFLVGMCEACLEKISKCHCEEGEPIVANGIFEMSKIACDPCLKHFRHVIHRLVPHGEPSVGPLAKELWMRVYGKATNPEIAEENWTLTLEALGLTDAN